MASRTVLRLAWNRSHNSRSVGRLSPTPNCPSEMSLRILTTIASTAEGIELRTMTHQRRGEAGSYQRRMEAAAEELRFEYAAELRDRLRAVKELQNHQRVIATAYSDTDAVGFQRGAKCCFTVLHFMNGNLSGKDVQMIVGNGYTKNHAEITLDVLRENPKIRELFDQKYV